MRNRTPNRKHSVIDGLKPELKDTVEQMLLTGSTYSEIVDYLAEHDVGISVASVCRYARAYNANMQMLTVAQENFRKMTEEMEKYPDLDTTEAIIRLASQNLFNAIASTPEDRWAEIDPSKMLKETNGLIRAAAYKKRVDIQNQDDYAAGLEAVKALVFDAMAKERPELYKQVTEFLNQKRKEGAE